MQRSAVDRYAPYTGVSPCQFPLYIIWVVLKVDDKHRLELGDIGIGPKVCWGRSLVACESHDGGDLRNG